MITKEQAIEIAKSKVPDLDDRRNSISSTKPYMNVLDVYADSLENCWYIIYSIHPRNSDILFHGASQGIFINKFTGKIVFHSSLRDEG